MAHFRGTVQGNRAEASRLGTKNSGLVVTANGWEIGVDVRLGINKEGEDFVDITVNRGSNGYETLRTETLKLNKKGNLVKV